MQVADILKSLGERNLQSRWGVGVASQYFNDDIVPCFTGDGLCPVKFFGLASADAWKKELDAAVERLTWADEGSAVRSHASGSDKSILDFDAVLTTRRVDRDGDVLEPKGLTLDQNMPLLWQHLQLQPIGKLKSIIEQNDSHVVCKFGIADTDLGRDAATLVEFGALRMSHGFKPKTFEPRLTGKDSKGADVVLGWHVKEADVFEGSTVSIPANSGAKVLESYRKEFDGVCTAFGDRKLKNAMVKLWAKRLYDQRPVQGRGFGPGAATNETIEVPLTLSVNIKGANGRPLAESDLARSEAAVSGEKTPGAARLTQEGSGAAPPDAGTKAGKVLSMANYTKLAGARDAISEVLAAAGEGGDSGASAGAASGGMMDIVMGQRNLSALATKRINFDAAGATGTKDASDAYDPHVPGSWEWVSWHLRKTAAAYLRSRGVSVGEGGYDNDDYRFSIAATFPNDAVICYRRYNADPKCWRVAWEMGESGNPMWSGTPEEVKVQPQVIAKTQPAAAEVPMAEMAKQLVAKAMTAANPADAIKALQPVVDAAEWANQLCELADYESALNSLNPVGAT